MLHEEYRMSPTCLYLPEAYRYLPEAYRDMALETPVLSEQRQLLIRPGKTRAPKARYGHGFDPALEPESVPPGVE